MKPLRLVARTEGISGEPLVTQWLAAILDVPAYQRALLKILLGSTADKFTEIFEVEGEAVGIDGTGRPDTRLENEMAHILIENKFDAALTINQPAGYLKDLSTRRQKYKILIFLVPHSRVRELETHLGKSANIAKSQGITMGIKDWESLAEKLLTAFPDSELVIEFTHDIFRRCRMVQPLTGDEIKQSISALSLVQKQSELMNFIRQEIEARPIGGIQWSASGGTKPILDSGGDLYFGLEVRNAKGSLAWLGFWNYSKSVNKNSFFGHVYDSDLARQALPFFWTNLEKLKKNNLVLARYKKYGYPFPVPMKMLEESASLREQAKKITDYFTSILEGRLIK